MEIWQDDWPTRDEIVETLAMLSCGPPHAAVAVVEYDGLPYVSPAELLYSRNRRSAYVRAEQRQKREAQRYREERLAAERQRERERRRRAIEAIAERKQTATRVQQAYFDSHGWAPHILDEPEADGAMYFCLVCDRPFLGRTGTICREGPDPDYRMAQFIGKA